MRISSLQDLEQVAALFNKALDNQKTKVLVCAGNGCVAGGALEIYKKLRELIEKHGLLVDIELQQERTGIGVKKSGCYGFCEMGPLVKILPQDYFYLKVNVEDCAEIVNTTLIDGKPIEKLMYSDNGVICPAQNDIPFYKKQMRLVLENCGQIDAEEIGEYIARGGYAAMGKCLHDMSREQICQEITDANLRGRGGGGFPAGRKWTLVLAQKSEVKYVICNGDEGAPGAFTDKSIMEGDPHRIIEGMIIAGYATRSTKGYIHVRAEYPLVVQRLKKGIEQARQYGFLGEDILGSGFSFDIKINQGAGAFVCGEGSAVQAAIEGRRGNPRVKPPRTVEQGLWKKPTVLNNVETFANVPLIIMKGSKWFKSIGTEKSPGTKAFSLTGNVKYPGLIEVPMGTTLREVVFDIGGGIPNGRKLKAVQIGGPSGGCLTEEHLDLPLDFDSLTSVGAMIGSGGLVVMDDSACMVEVARFSMDFIQNASCGKCVPCREGTKRMLEILNRIVEGKGTISDLGLLIEIGDTVSSTSLCGLGETAANPVVTTLRYFRDEYLTHVTRKKCPTNTCKGLKTIVIDTALCKGCTKCAKACLIDAIEGVVKKPHTVIQDKCVKCGVCIEACVFNAIKEV